MYLFFELTIVACIDDDAENVECFGSKFSSRIRLGRVLEESCFEQFYHKMEGAHHPKSPMPFPPPTISLMYIQ